MKTKKDIKYKSLMFTCIIPKNTKVIKATNLPDKDLYWVEPWENMSSEEESWNRNYGFLLTKEEIKKEI